MLAISYVDTVDIQEFLLLSSKQKWIFQVLRSFPLWPSFNRFLRNKCLNLSHRIPTFIVHKTFVNIVEREGNVDYQDFLLFPQCFLSRQDEKSVFLLRFICRLQML